MADFVDTFVDYSYFSYFIPYYLLFYLSQAPVDHLGSGCLQDSEIGCSRSFDSGSSDDYSVCCEC